METKEKAVNITREGACLLVLAVVKPIPVVFVMMKITLMF